MIFTGQVLFTCGPSCDKLLFSQRHSLPAICTQTYVHGRNSSDIGLLNTVFELLQLNVAQMHDKERDCKMSTTPSADYDQPDSWSHFTSSHSKSNVVCPWYWCCLVSEPNGHSQSQRPFIAIGTHQWISSEAHYGYHHLKRLGNRFQRPNSYLWHGSM